MPERALRHTRSPLEPAPLRGLYAVTPDGLPEAALLAQAEAALAGGAAVMQLRDKSSDAARRLRLAQALAALCRRHGALFIVNDDLQLALAVGADGVHLGADDGDPRAARQALPPGSVVGVSCYADFARARVAVAAGADYVAFGAVFASPTKPQAPRASLDLLARTRAELGVPACAIGGITLANAGEVIAAGADLLAVVSEVFSPASSFSSAPTSAASSATSAIRARAAAFQRLFEENRA
ncbi:thiamine phosphate synthase [Rhodocyclus tenuis]|uniref:thiamine phosphate synthase n=1 Tax=Rhodocyclus tenuis TaxID=1066 RepID=UPI0019053590|nr:thiamine phosphate synthase [Rhodocyclus tenuis]MBK1681903.1 thiamine phosphate synthase [Rhodocyclus tenuis]